MRRRRRESELFAVARDRERLASYDSFIYAPRHHGLEQFSKQIALAETAVAVLGKRLMIGNVAVEAQATRPAGGKIDLNLIAQPALRTDAGAVAYNQHAHHQLGIDREAPDVAI
jgi:hypothetical protein